MPDSPSPDAPAPPPPSRWERLLNANAVTALITVLIGGVLGNYVISRTQENNKERELALLGYKEYLGAQLKSVEQVYDLIGSVRAAAGDLIAITGAEFDPGRFPAKDAEAVRAEAVSVQRRYNSASVKWRSGRDSLAYMMLYYHHAQPDAVAAWRKLEKAIDACTACAEQWHNAHIALHDTAPSAAPCGAEQSAADASLADLTAALAKAQGARWLSAPTP